MSIYQTFALLKKTDIVIVDEFNYKSFNSNLTSSESVDNFSSTNAKEFCDKIEFEKYIYSSDKEILFALECESPFFVIATSKANMDKIISHSLFEGFLCDETTTQWWYYKRD